MLKIIKRSNWLVGALIFFMPILFIFFLASQMAYSQVKSKFEAYQGIPEITSLAELSAVAPGKLVILRGAISAATPADNHDLIVYQERPAGGREVRYREEFPLIFPEFIMELPDGRLAVLPSLTRERVIQHELHTVTSGDRTYTGFRIGDTVTVQGQWQPRIGQEMASLGEVTGISSIDKAGLMAEWQDAFQKVSWVRNGLGLVTLLGIILLVIQFRRAKSKPIPEETQTWPTQETTTATTT